MTFNTRRERRAAEKLQARQARNRRLAAGGASLSILVGATFASSTAAVAAPVSAVVKASTASTTTGLNMRSGPGVGNSVITVLQRGAAVTPTGQSKGSWVRITSSGRTGWVNSRYLTAASVSSSSTIQYQLASATSTSSWKGTAAGWARSKANSSATYYAWGGNGPNGYDCSGFTTGAFAAAGKSLPRTSRTQYTAADSYTSLGNIQVGDLVFWSSNGAASGIYHVAIYIGDGKIAHARNASSGVSVTSLNYSPYNMLKTAARFN